MQTIRLNREFTARLEGIIESPRLLFNEPLSLHTTFRIGGPADALVMPSSPEEVAAVLKLAKEFAVPVTILGNGSNVLVLDGGVRGLVVKFGEAMSQLRHEGSKIFAGAGAALGDVSRYAASLGLTGLEFAVGIPGSIGGAVFMNAGAYDGEISSVVSAVTAVCPGGNVCGFKPEDIAFSYRDSVFQHNACIVCEVELTLTPGESENIHCLMTDLTSRRESKQPIELPSAGSTFKRPPGHFAGTLIEQAGLKGHKFGGAQVSEKHAGFIINSGGATASDVLSLIRVVQEKVFAMSGVKLHPEVRVIGEE